MRSLSLLPWKATTPAQCLFGAGVFVVLSIVCAALLYRFFESPILRWRDRITSR